MSPLFWLRQVFCGLKIHNLCYISYVIGAVAALLTQQQPYQRLSKFAVSRQTGAIFLFTIGPDSEVICYVLLQERLKCNSSAIWRGGCPYYEGLTRLCGISLLVIRETYGSESPWPAQFQSPLCMGKYNDSVVFYSESAALDVTGAKFIQILNPWNCGSWLTIKKSAVHKLISEEKDSHFVFLGLIYLPHSDSLLMVSASMGRGEKTGRILARSFLQRRGYGL